MEDGRLTSRKLYAETASHLSESYYFVRERSPFNSHSLNRFDFFDDRAEKSLHKKHHNSFSILIRIINRVCRLCLT